MFWEYSLYIIFACVNNTWKRGNSQLAKRNSPAADYCSLWQWFPVVSSNLLVALNCASFYICPHAFTRRSRLFNSDGGVHLKSESNTAQLDCQKVICKHSAILLPMAGCARRVPQKTGEVMGCQVSAPILQRTKPVAQSALANHERWGIPLVVGVQVHILETFYRILRIK